jgi:hypothetical protein
MITGRCVGVRLRGAVRARVVLRAAVRLRAPLRLAALRAAALRALALRAPALRALALRAPVRFLFFVALRRAIRLLCEPRLAAGPSKQNSCPLILALR